MPQLCHEHFVQMPRRARPRPHGSGPAREHCTEPVAPVTHRFLRYHHAALEQQLLDVTQAQVEPMVLAYRAADGRGRETEAVIRRAILLHSAILPSHAFNLTLPNTYVTAEMPACGCGAKVGPLM